MAGPTPLEASRSPFDAATMAAYALNPHGTKLFRAQHGWLSAQMERVDRGIQGKAAEQNLAEVIVSLSGLLANWHVHTQFETALLARALSSEPRMLMTLDQLEGESTNARLELHSLYRRIAARETRLDVVTKESAAVFARLRDICRREERTLFPTFDRATLSASIAAHVGSSNL